MISLDFPPWYLRENDGPERPEREGPGWFGLGPWFWLTLGVFVSLLVLNRLIGPAGVAVLWALGLAGFFALWAWNRRR